MVGIILVLAVGQLDFLHRYRTLEEGVANLELASSLIEATWATQTVAKTARYRPDGLDEAYELGDEIDSNLDQALRSWTVTCGECTREEALHSQARLRARRLQDGRRQYLEVLAASQREEASVAELNLAFDDLNAHTELTHLAFSRKRRELQAEVMTGRAAIQADMVVVGSSTVIGSVLLTLLFARSRRRSEAIARHRAAELEAATKTQLLTTVSHELRTPLTGILGLCEELKLEGVEKGQARELGTAIEERGQTLLAMVDGLLLLQQQGKSSIRSVRSPYPSEKLEEVLIHPFRAQLRNRSISLVLRGSDSLPPVLIFDHEHTLVALLRLVENAVRFTERGAVELTVEHRTAAQNGAEEDSLRFHLSDTGPGLPRAERDQLFELFAQAESGLTRSHEGLGIGLPLASALITAVGGALRLVSSDRAGTRYAIDVPCSVDELASAPEEAPCPTSPAVEAQPAPPTLAICSRVLIAEDNPVNRRILERMLGTIASEVHSVENGKLAVEAVRESNASGRPFDLVVMDMQMPVMDGYEATRQISAMMEDLPVVACTAHANPGDRERCLEAGCDEYVTKPIVRPVFEAAVRSLMASG